MNPLPLTPTPYPLAGLTAFVPRRMRQTAKPEPYTMPIRADDRAVIGFAAATALDGYADLGSDLLRRLEARWGLTGYERLAGMVEARQISIEDAARLRQTTAVPIRERRRSNEKAALKRAELLNAPLADYAPSEKVRRAEIVLHDAIDRRTEIRAKIPVDRRALVEATTAVREAQAAFDAAKREQKDTRWRGFAEGEAEALAKAREDDMEWGEVEIATWAVDKDGNRILDKGRPSLVVTTAQVLMAQHGLDALLTGEKITKAEYVAGSRYHDHYQDVDPEKALAPPDPDRITGRQAHADPFGESFCKPLFDRIEKAEKLADLEKAVIYGIRAHYHAEGPAKANQAAAEALAILRAVAGKGQSIRQAVHGGASKRTRLTDLLKIALGVLADEAGLQ